MYPLIITSNQIVDLTKYILYYFDTNQAANFNGCLWYVNTTNGANYILVSNLIAPLYFTAENYDGTTNTVQSYKSVVHVTFQFAQFQYPLTQVGSNGLFNSYRIDVRATPHLPDGRMKTKHTSPIRSSGSALLMVLIMCAVSLVIMVAIMNRTSTVSNLNNRNNQYAVCCTAAEAAVEKVFARMAYDFQNYGLGQVTNNLVAGVYQTNIPTAAEGSYWTNFVFFDPQTGTTEQIYVNFLTNYAGPLPSQYTNICTITAPIYRIIANASMTNSPGVVGTAQEDVLLSLVPITTYAIFYNGPLEFTQCATMTVRGRTHANDIICVGTSASLTFNNIVTSTKTVDGPTRDGVTPSPWNQDTTFNGSYSTNVASVTVAMNMTNTHALLEIPPPGESPTSILGAQRLYNQAHVLVMVTNVMVAAGTNSSTPQPFVEISLRTSINDLVPGADTQTNGYIYDYFLTNNISTTNRTPPFTWVTNLVFTNYSISQSTNEPQNIATWLSLTNTFYRPAGISNQYVCDPD